MGFGRLVGLKPKRMIHDADFLGMSTKWPKKELAELSYACVWHVFKDHLDRQVMGLTN